MALGVDTATEYFHQEEAISKAYSALEEQVNTEYSRVMKEAEAKRNAILNDPNSTAGKRAAAIAAFKAIEKRMSKWAAERLDGPRRARDAALRLLADEA